MAIKQQESSDTNVKTQYIHIAHMGFGLPQLRNIIRRIDARCLIRADAESTEFFVYASRLVNVGLATRVAPWFHDHRSKVPRWWTARENENNWRERNVEREYPGSIQNWSYDFRYLFWVSQQIYIDILNKSPNTTNIRLTLFNIFPILNWINHI